MLKSLACIIFIVGLFSRMIFSRQAAKTCIPRGAFAFFAPLREDKLQIINDPTYVTILQPSAVKIYE